jgi:hypothetical protein
MSVAIKEVLTNPEVLAVHKDPLVSMAVRVDVGGGVDAGHYQCNSAFSVYGRKLVDGSSAVMVLNRGDTASSTSVHMEDIGDSMHLHYAVRDLWNRTDLPPAANNMAVEVPARGVRFFRMTPIKPPPTPPPTPPPPPKPCPGNSTAAKWKQRTPGGYWKNTGPDDKASGASMELCAAKCIATPNCSAFEVFDVGQKGAGCYTFVGTLEQPFTANEASSTCIRAN